MRFPSALLPCTLLRRYKRFLADVRFDSGEEAVVHCPNPGGMLGCAVPGWRALASDSGNPGRKLRHTLEMVHNGRCWIGVNPALANAVAAEGLRAGLVSDLADYPDMRREAVWGEGTRFDFRLTGMRGECYVEVKSVTLVMEDGYSAFPDAVTVRGARHIRELLAARAAGHRAVLLFVVQRADGLKGFRAAAEIDPVYAESLRQAHAAGLEVYAHLAEVGPEGITLTADRLPISF
jgi:sugar fermentation stimulation protein A